jgi:hypothetical protein
MSENSKVNLDVLMPLLIFSCCVLQSLCLSFPLSMTSLVINISFLYTNIYVSYCKDFGCTNNPMRSTDS